MSAKLTSESLSRLNSQGHSDAACGRYFGVSKYAIRRLRRRWNIPARRLPERPSDGLETKPDRWGRGDLDQAQIAQIYGDTRYGPGPAPRSSVAARRPSSEVMAPVAADGGPGFRVEAPSHGLGRQA